MRCKWCHNPETHSAKPQMFYTAQNCIGCGACVNACKTGAHYFDAENHHCFDVQRCAGCMACAEVCFTKAIESVSRMMSVKEIVEIVLKDAAFYGEIGGLTLSGGEPLIYADGCVEILRAAKEAGISTAIETAGYCNEACIDAVAELTDVFLWDFKVGSNELHIKYTGVSNEKILSNLFHLDKKAKRIILRCIMVKGVNMAPESLRAIVDIRRALTNCADIELIPYHAYGGSKSKRLGYADSGKKEWIPTAEDMKKAREFISF